MLLFLLIAMSLVIATDITLAHARGKGHYHDNDSFPGRRFYHGKGPFLDRSATPELGLDNLTNLLQTLGFNGTCAAANLFNCCQDIVQDQYPSLIQVRAVFLNLTKTAMITTVPTHINVGLLQFAYS